MTRRREIERGVRGSLSLELCELRRARQSFCERFGEVGAHQKAVTPAGRRRRCTVVFQVLTLCCALNVRRRKRQKVQSLSISPKVMPRCVLCACAVPGRRTKRGVRGGAHRASAQDAARSARACCRPSTRHQIINPTRIKHVREKKPTTKKLLAPKTSSTSIINKIIITRIQPPAPHSRVLFQKKRFVLCFKEALPLARRAKRPV